MKNKFILIFFCLIDFMVFSQEGSNSYYFDCAITSYYKNYLYSIDRKQVLFTNTKDSTYSLLLSYGKIFKDGTLCDKKKKELVDFHLPFEYKNVDDLTKLKYANHESPHTHLKQKIYKNLVKEYQVERDTINKKIIVRIINYKNSKKKKILFENYYHFGDNKNCENIYTEKIKKYIIESCKLIELENLYIEKNLFVKDGKIESETNYLEYSKINYVFKCEKVEIKSKKLILSDQ